MAKKRANRQHPEKAQRSLDDTPRAQLSTAASSSVSAARRRPSGRVKLAKHYPGQPGISGELQRRLHCGGGCV